MPATTTTNTAILSIHEFNPTERGARLVFENGAVASLEQSHPNFAAIRVHAEQAQRRGIPVGVVLDSEGRIVDLNTAHDSSVRFIREDRDNPDIFEVAFWSFSSACCLNRDHPEFDRLHSLLVDAVGSGQMVWFANHFEMVEVEQDGDTYLIWKILDVRPIHGTAQ